MWREASSQPRESGFLLVPLLANVNSVQRHVTDSCSAWHCYGGFACCDVHMSKNVWVSQAFECVLQRTRCMWGEILASPLCCWNICCSRQICLNSTDEQCLVVDFWCAGYDHLIIHWNVVRSMSLLRSIQKQIANILNYHIIRCNNRCFHFDWWQRIRFSSN